MKLATIIFITPRYSTTRFIEKNYLSFLLNSIHPPRVTRPRSEVPLSMPTPAVRSVHFLILRSLRQLSNLTRVYIIVIASKLRYVDAQFDFVLFNRFIDNQLTRRASLRSQKEGKRNETLKFNAHCRFLLKLFFKNNKFIRTIEDTRFFFCVFCWRVHE